MHESSGSHDPDMTLTKAACIAAGWFYCAEHNRPLFRGTDPCHRKHQQDQPAERWCGVFEIPCPVMPGMSCDCQETA